MLLRFLVLIVIIFHLNGCETKMSKYADEEELSCITSKLNKLEKPFIESEIEEVITNCKIEVNEMMQDMKDEPWE